MHMTTLPSAADEDRPAYVDPHGRPRLRQSVVGFLDLLGFSNSIAATTDPARAQHLVERIVAAIEDSRQYVRSDLAAEFARLPHAWGMKFFSDNLVVSYPIEGEDVAASTAALFVIRCAQRYQLRMTLNGFFLRGGLAEGSICLTDEILFGAALLECYQLESQASIVPRVILSGPLVRRVETALAETAGPLHDQIASSICRDIDGWWFVSYLEAARGAGGVDWDLVERHKQAVLDSLAGVTRHDVLPKYGWACRYHNMFCHWHREARGYSDSFRISRDDDRSVIARLQDVRA
jgi:hypothetical protein